MEIHRHHSSKTVILILTSVLSFAFVACGDASEKCWESGGQDKKACEKGCNDENSKYRQRACNAACNYGKNLSACSESCKLAEKFDHENENCSYPCEHGDDIACEKYKAYSKTQEDIAKGKALKALSDSAEETCDKKGNDSPECRMAVLAYFKASCDIDENDVNCVFASDLFMKMKSYDEAYAYCDKACKLAPHQCWVCGMKINDPRRALEFYQRGCEHGSKQACDFYNKIKVVPTPTPSQTQAQPGSTPSTEPIPAAVQPIPTPSHDPTPTQAQPFPDIDAPAQIDTNAASDDPTVGGSTAQRYGIQYIREITYKGKSTPSWIILKDPKGRYCAIITSSKYPVLEIEHYCIPFSGDDKDLKDSFAGNRVAEIDFPDHKQCKNIDTVSNNDYCNRFYKAFEEVAQKEQFLAVTDICRNDPDVDSVFWSRVCEHLALEHDLD